MPAPALGAKGTRMLDLADKRVLVVGGSSGIGLAVAEAAAAAGAQVAIASRSSDRIEAALGRIGRRAVGRTLDTTDDAAVEAFFADTAPFDHVVISAAETKGGPIKELPLADAYAGMNSKFWGAYRVARAASIVPGGSLTFVSGAWSRRAPAGRAVNAAINAAVEGLTRGLAVEFAPVRVNAVSPGVVETPLWSGMDEATRKATFERIAASLPAGRIGEATDVAQAVLMLMTNPFAAGSIIYLEGGGLLV
jgi:NAD(P)-dependent dehydrogenase (short-subunit alcohol dehydrogenase family)